MADFGLAKVVDSLTMLRVSERKYDIFDAPDTEECNFTDDVWYSVLPCSGSRPANAPSGL